MKKLFKIHYNDIPQAIYIVAADFKECEFLLIQAKTKLNEEGELSIKSMEFVSDNILIN